MKKVINVGLFGLGTVGKSVLKNIKKNGELIEQRSELQVAVKKIVVSNLNKDRGIDLTGIGISDNPSFILEDDSIDIVIELIGDLELSERIIIDSLTRGKAVITANKAVIARKSRAIFNAAYNSNSLFGFESSVGSGIPVIRSISQGFAGDKITAISGILNSTSNFILSKMCKTGEDFVRVLQDAKDLGYAEPNPSFDVDGYDAAHKLIVLMNLSFNKLFSYDDLYIEGITKIQTLDINFAKELGYVVKHIGWAEHKGNKFFAGVHPVLIKEDDNMAWVDGVYNSIKVVTENGGPFTFQGLGAGADAAASGVISDLVAAVRSIETKQESTINPLSITENKLVSSNIEKLDSVVFSFYLRFTVADKPRVLSDITKILGDNNVSISSFIQKKAPNNQIDSVPVVIITHETTEKQIKDSIELIEKLDCIKASSMAIRIINVN